MKANKEHNAMNFRRFRPTAISLKAWGYGLRYSFIVSCLTEWTHAFHTRTSPVTCLVLLQKVLESKTSQENKPSQNISFSVDFFYFFSFRITFGQNPRTNTKLPNSCFECLMLPFCCPHWIVFSVSLLPPLIKSTRLLQNWSVRSKKAD